MKLLTNVKFLSVIFLLCLTIPLQAQSSNTKTVMNDNSKPLIMGVFPRRNARTSVKFFTPLANHLSEKLGVKVKLAVSKNFKSFWSGVKNKRYDIVHYNQYHYVVSHKKYNYEVIAKNTEFGEATIAGAIIVRTDTGINSIADLKGKTVSFGGGPKAMQSYIVARYLLEKGGLKKGDYREIFAKNPPNAIFSAFYKQAEAAGAGDKVLRLNVVAKKADTNKLKILAVGEQLTHLPWAVSGDLSASLRNKIQKILTTLKSNDVGKSILKSAKLDDLQASSDKEYDKHRKIIYSVYGEKY